MDIETYIGITL